MFIRYIPSLESMLHHHVSLSDFEAAGVALENYPRIYRSLPSHRGKIKENFSDLKALKRHWIDKAILSLYKKPSTIHLPIVIFTWVMPPGLGDWTAQNEIAELIRKEYPFLPIYLVTLFHKSAPIASKGDHNYVFCYQEEKQLHFKFFPEKILSLLRSSSFILQTPTYYPFTEELLEKVRYDHPHPPRYELLGEYGFIDSPFFHPQTKARCMGLHFLEKGVVIKDISETQEIHALENKDLFCILQEGQKNHHRFYFAYLLTDRGMSIYVQLLLKMLENDRRDIDFCCTDIGAFLRKQEILIPVLQERGIQQVTFFYQSEFYFLPIQPKGKKLRFIHLPALSFLDFQCLMSISEDPVGCRGDQSFSLAVSLNKPFFYDPPKHALAFLHDLVALAEHRLSEYPSLICFLQLSLKILSSTEDNEIAAEMATQLQDPELFLGFKQLAEIIRKEHCVNSMLIQLVNRSLFHFQYPDKAQKEEELITEFLEEKKGFKEMIQAISALVLSSTEVAPGEPYDRTPQ